MKKMKTTNHASSKNDIKINYLDVLRVLATFAVILLHYSGSYTYRIGIPTFDLGIIIFSLTRWSVPIFLMITGALLLQKNVDIVLFYKKRMKRLLLPLLFYSFVYIIYRIIKDEFIIKDLIQIVFVKGAYFHFWYVYMLIGIVLFIPFLTSWTERKDRISILIFISIWIYWLVIPNNYSQYNTAINLSYFGGYIGYVVLGHYLHITKIKYPIIIA